ncbi:MAG: hypothetical protein GY856_16370, partial [bacterium]|nr:hypothetical protein [bacterium]
STYILDKFSHRFQLESEKVAAFCARHGVTRPLIDEVLKRFLGRKVLILGDPILDHYVHCDALSIASESPVLNVTPIREDWYLGAAAVMARQAVHLGAEATLVTLLGRGPESERFTAAMEQAGVRLIAVGEDDRPVYVKTRYLVDDAKVFKVNTGRYAPPSSLAMRELTRMLEDLLGEHDAVVAPDFGYGLFSGDLVAGLERISRAHGKPYFVDVSTNGANVLKFKRPRLAAPTEEELRFAFADQESGLSHLASCYYAETDAEQLVLTLGKKGAVYFGPPEPDRARLRTEYLPALTHHPIDAVGAGDVFTILLALADLSGASPPVGLYLASCVAALQVSNLGNDPPDLLDLRSFLNERPELVADPAGT